MEYNHDRELTLLSHDKYLEETFGLGVFRFPVDDESFKFGDAEVVEVKEKAVRPIGL